MTDKDLEARVSRLEELVSELVGMGNQPTEGVLEAAHKRFKDRIRAEPAKAGKPRGQE